ncbi:MAG: hypothetical protein IJ203_06575 [Atopobiaceae bacterium]|nr:hypothetical protein [Atopobiaceae bacterium]
MKHFRRAVLFVVLLTLSLIGLQRLFIVGPFSSDERVGRDNHASFREQPDNSLDVVYVGASNVYSFWESPIAWSRYGLASQSYANWSMPPAAIRYIIDECRKTQPNALYVVNVNNFREEGNSALKHCHWTTDDMPLSREKIELIQALCEQNGYDLDEAIELVFPLLGFHSTWSDLQSEDFAPQYANVGGAATNARHFSTQDVTGSFNTCRNLRANLESYGPFDEESLRRDSLDDLIAYCKREDVSILFVLQPQAITDPEILHNLNELCAIVQEEGMDLVDLSDPALIGLDPATDFWNPRHTNSHGSIKYTDYLARYITDTYIIPDRRSDERYAEWNETSKRYEQFLMTHNVREFEFDLPQYRADLRTYNLSARNMHLFVKLAWSPASEADEYLVYRQEVKSIDNPATEENLERYMWKRIAVLPSDATSYIDLEACERHPLLGSATVSSEKDVETGIEEVQYDYAVIPVLHTEDGDVYGSYYSKRATAMLRCVAEEEA